MSLSRQETSRIILEYSQSYVDRANRVREKTELTHRGLILRGIGTMFTFIGSGLITYRAFDNGSLSFYGVFLRMVSFVILGLLFCFDSRLERSERLMYSGPKFAGFMMCCVQLFGIFQTREDALSTI